MSAVSPAANATSFRPPRPPYPSSSPPSSPALSAARATSPLPTTSSAAADGDDRKRANPLLDLIETEKRYVDELGLVIRRVAAAWSRSNFPPPLLDAMFRSIEAVYKTNRTFGSKLKEIGPNPSSPKALGDLLMSWIEDMQGPYTRYCRTYLSSFDTWPPVQDNPKLGPILAELSVSLPPAPGVGDANGRWTLDALFALPFARLKYYKKLYARLLKSTQPGRSDHTQLLGANDRLTDWLDTVRDRLSRTVEDEAAGRSPPPPPAQSVASPASRMSAGSGTSGSGSAQDSRQSGGSMFSANGRAPSMSSPSTSFGSAAPQSHPLPPPPKLTSSNSDDDLPPQPLSPGGMSQMLVDIERRLDSDRTVDLFTMKPRKVRLQISPPALPFTRKLRRALQVEIFFTPTSTGEKVHHLSGYIFVLSDLFLICERMDPGDRARKVAEAGGGQGPDLWLCYPPLAGKHLSVAPGPTENHVEIGVMRKETFMLRFEEKGLQGKIMKEFQDCIDFAHSMSLAIQTNQPPPPQSAGPQPHSAFGGGAGPNTPWGQSNGGSQSPLPPLPLPPSSPNLGLASPSMSVRSSGSTGPSVYANSPPIGYGPPGGAGRAFSSDSHTSYGSNGGIISQLDTMSLSSPGPNHVSHASQFDRPLPPISSAALPLPPRPSHPSQQNQYGNGSAHGAGSLPPPPGRDGSLPPPGRGASLGPRAPSPGGGAGCGSVGFNQFPPPQQRGPHQHDQGGLGRPPIAQPHPQPYPGRHVSGPLPSGSAGFGMGVVRSPSTGTTRSQPGPSSPDELPPLPPHPGSFINGPGGSRYGSPGPGGYGSSPSSSPNPPFAQPGYPSSTRSSSPASSSHFEPLSLPSSAFSSQRALESSGTTSFDPLTGRPAESLDLDSPPPSPSREVDPATIQGPAVVSASMKCKVFLKTSHAQWKSLGAGRLKLWLEQASNIKQLVVEADSSSAKMLISTIVLTDGVERVGKTGVAVEISDQGSRTGVIYMIQLRNETSAVGLFESLLQGTNRAARA